MPDFKAASAERLYFVKKWIDLFIAMANAVPIMFAIVAKPKVPQQDVPINWIEMD